jgi:hypothetical protein
MSVAARCRALQGVDGDVFDFSPPSIGTLLGGRHRRVTDASPSNQGRDLLGRRVVGLGHVDRSTWPEPLSGAQRMAGRHSLHARLAHERAVAGSIPAAPTLTFAT